MALARKKLRIRLKFCAIRTHIPQRARARVSLRGALVDPYLVAQIGGLINAISIVSREVNETLFAARPNNAVLLHIEAAHRVFARDYSRAPPSPQLIPPKSPSISAYF